MTEATAGVAPDYDELPELDQAVESRLRPEIRPRSSWGELLPPTGPLTVEDEVRLLVVHHTASTNDYGSDEVVDEIRDFYEFHIGPDRGWPDVAYNFLIDRFGGVWEARQGSLKDPIRGDATGGSQGFALLVSLIGNHVEAPPTPEALDSLSRLLAWLAHRYRIDTAPGATTRFTSQGSSRWAAGAEVTARTVSGHRDMSITTCPGDSVYGLLDRSLPEQIELLRQGALVEASEERGAGVLEPSDEPDTTPATIGSESVAVGTDSVESAGSAVAGDETDRYLISAGTTMVLGGVAGLIALRRRRVQA